MKKVVSLLLVAVLAIGMATVGFAKPANAVNGYDLSAGSTSIAATSDGSYPYPFPGDVRPDTEVMVCVFKVADFTYDGAAPTYLTKKFMKDSKVTLKNNARSGSKALDSFEWDDTTYTDTTVTPTVTVKTVGIKVNFIDPFVSTSDLDFEWRIYLVFDGTRSESTFYVDVSGTFANEVTEVDSDSDYVDLSDGFVAEATSYIKDIEVELGNDVFMHAKMFNGKKYYGISSLDPEDADDAVMSKYPSIDTVITLKTVGLAASGNYTDLSAYGSDYYVYNKDMKYLGKSGDKLEYSTKYYLSTAEIETEDDGDVTGEPEEEGEGDGPEDGPETGGDGDYVANANDNPGTGR